MHLILDTKGINMKVRNGCFQLQTEQHERIISPLKITSIAILTQCWLSSSAIRLAIQHKIPIYFHDGIGNVEGRLWSASFGHLATLRRKQVLFEIDKKATAWVVELFRLKTQEQIENLAFLKLKKPTYATAIDTAILQSKTLISDYDNFLDSTLRACAASMMGKEGNIARYYWQAIATSMPEGFSFDDRNRRPAKDNFNAAINYLYGMLYGLVENALFSAGLDPQLGFLHADEYNMPTLSFDLIEPFRPWVDRLLLEAILEYDVKEAFFEAHQDGKWLSKAGKQFFIPRFYEYFEAKSLFREKLLSRKNQIYRMAADFSDILLNFTIDIAQ